MEYHPSIHKWFTLLMDGAGMLKLNMSEKSKTEISICFIF